MRFFVLGLAGCTAGLSTLAPIVDEAPRVLAPGWVSTGDDDAHAVFSPDGETLFFLKDTPSFDFYTIVQIDHGPGGWSRPHVASISGQYPDGDLVFAPGGHRAYFVSSRPVDGVPRTDTEIWTVEYTATASIDHRFGTPTHVAELTSPGDEWFPTFASDGTIYFGSCRPGCDLYRAPWLGDHFGPPENLGAPINSDAEEIEPLIAPDQSFLVFSAKGRPDSLGSYDLYIAQRDGTGWATPTHLPAPINSSAWEFGPRLSPDGKWFMFTSNRGFGSAPQPHALDFATLEQRLHAPGNGLRDIYVVDARVLRASAR